MTISSRGLDNLDFNFIERVYGTIQQGVGEGPRKQENFVDCRLTLSFFLLGPWLDDFVDKES